MTRDHYPLNTLVHLDTQLVIGLLVRGTLEYGGLQVDWKVSCGRPGLLGAPTGGISAQPSGGGQTCVPRKPWLQRPGHAIRGSGSWGGSFSSMIVSLGWSQASRVWAHLVPVGS